MRGLIRFLAVWFCVLGVFSVSAQKTYDQLSTDERKLYNEHIIEGQPDHDTPVLVRHGYVSHYNAKYRIPDWVAYHIVQGYLDTPERKGKFSSFRKDPDVEDPVVDPDYTGSNYARGHMAPYFAMGGHRNLDDDEVGEFDGDSEYDQQTIFEANYMTNISPQHQLGLNGPGGAWYALETAIRTNLVGDKDMELNLVVGAIILNPDNYKTIKSTKTGKTSIAIPDEFFQVLIYKDPATKEFMTAAFLFPHVKKKPKKPLLEYLVKVDDIEEKTGLDLLNELTPAQQAKCEGVTNLEYWEKIFKKQ